MIRIPRRFAAVDPIAAALRGRRRPHHLAVATLAFASIAPTGLLPLPTLPTSSASPTGPDAVAPITAGVVLTAVDNAGHPLAHAQFEVYRADQPDGVQQPMLPIPAVSTSGTVSVPLPAPATIPDPDSNYYVVSTGNDATGEPFTGIEYFDLTAAHPVTSAMVSPNLFVQVPPVTNTGQLPPVGIPPTSGPCGYDPLAAHAPTPNYFTITSQTQGVSDGTVNVGVVYGAGYWPGNAGQADVRYNPVRAVGESLLSKWSRVTESSVVLGLDLGGETQTKYHIVGDVHFTLASGDEAEYADAGRGVSLGGQGARALVASATWDHKSVTFHCNEGPDAGKSETHELWQPHQWNPHISTTTPDYPDDKGSLEAMEEQNASLVTPMASDQWDTESAGYSETYTNGYSAAIGAGPAGLDFSVESKTTYGSTHETSIFSGDDCGDQNQPLCFYWAVDDTAETSCVYQMACGTDYYAAVYKTPPAVPVGPQPCSKFEPHGACD